MTNTVGTDGATGSSESQEESTSYVGTFHLNPENEFQGHVAQSEESSRSCICHSCSRTRHAGMDSCD